ncbi:DUF1836 domain-containing protein [Acetobacterium woodii]|uniref:DUF1836 domain-containing protein n=1 Tax=Acetobacterium woodii (strain ATCC 29683 / DSM 1030 / JCM 2381 / KCTC 1655 / WB1) TaxID=931626 RepID=H6LIN9_ACEWD|nr:DUF1836 domain-containing protein [Acetobacterium woodii]AFA48613.1 hypothetical protein Awo_c18330 [Acetobacterium woodii DSM 1030]
MENISADILNFHCPRWHELPDIDLYMDQLVTILEKNLIVFEQIWGEKIITSTMINNYVKQKVVVPPVKKRYNRGHLAYFFVVSIMKRVLSISETCDLIAYLINIYTIDQAYNLFCDELETAIKAVFSPTLNTNQPIDQPQNGLVILRSAALAFANKIYFQVSIKNL